MSNPIRVLIVEDRAADAELMLHELRQAGFDPHCQRVEFEPDFVAALETNPDLILADWSLPQFNGLRALQLMNERSQGIPFIIVSGSIGEEEAVQAIRQGADDYLLKDRLTRLGEAVCRALEDKQLREERKQAEESLRVALTKYKTLFDCFPLGITVADEAGNILETNTTAEILLGVPQDEQSKRDIDSHQWRILRPDGTPMPPDEYASVRALKQKCKVENVEMGIVKSDKMTTWINVTAAPLPLEGYGVVITYSDITDRKRAEAEIQSLARFPFENPGPILRIALDGTLLYVNPSGLSLLPEWHLQAGQAVPPMLREAALQANKNGKMQVLDIEVGERVFSFSVAPIVAAGYANFYGIDITDRKLADEELQKSELRYRELFNRMSSGVAVYEAIDNGREFIIKDFNPSAEKIEKVNKKDVLGKCLTTAFPGVKAFGIFEVFQRVWQTGKPEYFPPNIYKDEKDPGSWRESWVFKLSAGELVAIYDNITERKLAEEKLHEYSENLEEMVEERTRALTEAQEKLIRQERLAVLGQISGSVSHELRNPLGVISNAIYYLKLVQPDADEKIKKYHAMIEREVQTTDKIIADLLDFARLKSADREPVSVTAVVQSALSRFPVPASVKVTLKLPTDLPQVFADSRQIEQILGNLTTNAWQAMPGGGKLTISGHVVVPVPARNRKKGMVAIAVKDSGVGIPPENIPKLFDPLFTTKINGIGLGLAVCKKLIESNDGRIEVQSEPGKGSSFTVYLPVQDGER